MEPVAVMKEKDVPYLPPGRMEKLDVYMPAERAQGPSLPGIVIIHGGGWFSQNKEGRRERAMAETVAAHGYVCVSIDYLLIDFDRPHEARAVWPANLRDCRAAVRFLRKNASRYGVDPGRIGAMGGSAGGHLAGLLACAGDLDIGEPEEERLVSCCVQAAVCLYGIGDLAGWVRNATERRKGLDAVQLMLGGTPEQAPEAYRAASPLTHASAVSAPLLLLHGTDDEVVSCRESERFARGLAAAGAPNELLLVPGAGHSFDLQPPQRDLRPAVLGFLDRTLKRA